MIGEKLPEVVKPEPLDTGALEYLARRFANLGIGRILGISFEQYVQTPEKYEQARKEKIAKSQMKSKFGNMKMAVA